MGLVSQGGEAMHEFSLIDKTSLTLEAHGQEKQKLTLISYC